MIWIHEQRGLCSTDKSDIRPIIFHIWRTLPKTNEIFSESGNRKIGRVAHQRKLTSVSVDRRMTEEKTNKFINSIVEQKNEQFTEVWSIV